jgi:hypothetical protein
MMPDTPKAPEPGDTLLWKNSGIEVRVTELTPAAVVFAWSNGAQGQLPWSEWFNYLQPAPKPEVKPGTTGTATVRGVKGIKVMRVTNEGGSDPHEMDPNWVSADLVDQGHKVNGYDGTYLHHDSDVTDFVPDEPRPLPERHEVHDALLKALGESFDCCDATDAIMALLRGESR